MNLTDEFQFTVHRSDRWWTAANDDLRVVTQGRTVPKLIDQIREALALALEDELGLDEVNPGSLRVTLRFDSDDAAAAVDAARAARRNAKRAAQIAVIETRVAAKILADQGVSMRDAAALLGYNHQRIHQLLTDA